MAIGGLGVCGCCNGGRKYRYLRLRGTLSPLRQYDEATGYDASKRYRKVTLTRQVVGSANVATKVYEWEWRWIEPDWPYIDGYAHGIFVKTVDEDNGVAAAFDALAIDSIVTVSVTTTTVTTHYYVDEVHAATDTLAISVEDTIPDLVSRINISLEAEIENAFAPDTSDIGRWRRGTWNITTSSYDWASDPDGDETFARHQDFPITSTPFGTFTSWEAGYDFDFDPNSYLGARGVSGYVIELMRCAIYQGSASYCRLDLHDPLSIWVDDHWEAQPTSCTTATASGNPWIVTLPPWTGFAHLHSAEIEEDFPAHYTGGVPVPWTYWDGTYHYHDCLCGETPL